MANINIKLSQTVVTANYQQLIKAPPTNGSLGTLFDIFPKLGALWARDHAYYSSFDFSGSQVRIGFPDGASTTYTGVVLEDPYALQGKASATKLSLYSSGLMSIVQNGKFNFDYANTTVNGANSVSITPTSVVLTDLTFATLLPSYSPNYDAVTGNVSITVKGSIKGDMSGNNVGTISRVTATADKFIVSANIDGNFNLSSNSISVAQGLSKSSVSGVMTSSVTEYRDGSYNRVTGVAVNVAANQQIDEKMLADESLFSGADTISVDLPATVYSDYLIASGAGGDLITINGGGGRLHVNAGSGNDAINVLTGNHNIDGGTGMDTVIMAGFASNYTVTTVGAGYQMRVKSNGDVDNLVNVERLQFGDKSLALDINGNAGQAYRIYQAAFDRKPDLEGLGYWIKDMDKGSSLTTVAAGFFQSAEFQKLYGANPSTTTLITNFYQNVLHRAPDQAGFDYWNNQLSKGQITAAGALASFCESAENQAQVIGSIQNGIEFKLWLG
ncbi:DUF4214 domain-containing protein [Undibacterium umbellatum]|uniref:DUF4214 domain-containing protein n=1 Tax=Undibacterium umbellatum TaxID=2762300 RepID=A0ABR6ZCU0_9BURK|nr:DUF4214 domain-containing protein [Undibacterium umbellatum]MBC3909573.1 DUF4214 domain-containing protein [Undibacterium umbellatum]